MQQPDFQSSSTKPIVIEVGGEPQGVVVPNDEGYRFVAVKYPVFGIDGRTFATVDEARLAATNVVAGHDGEE